MCFLFLFTTVHNDQVAMCFSYKRRKTKQKQKLVLSFGDPRKQPPIVGGGGWGEWWMTAVAKQTSSGFWERGARISQISPGAFWWLSETRLTSHRGLSLRITQRQLDISSGQVEMATKTYQPSKTLMRSLKSCRSFNESRQKVSF